MMLYIQQRTCPACGNARTANFERWGSHCFNCGMTFKSASRQLAQRVYPAEEWLIDLLSEAGMRTPAMA